MHHTSFLSVLDFDACERRFLLAGGADGSVYIHDLADFGGKKGLPGGKPRLVAHVGRSSSHCHRQSVTAAQWLPHDLGVFVTGGGDGVVKFWDADRLLPADIYGLESGICCLHLSPAAHQLLAAGTVGSEYVRLVDARSGSTTHTLRGGMGHTKAPVAACRWSIRDEHVLATGGFDGTVCLWDVRRGRSCLRSLDYNNIAVPSRKSKGITKRKSGSNNVKDGRGVSHDGAVNGLAFSEDGLSLYSFGCDGRLRQWCMETGRNLKAKLPRLINPAVSVRKSALHSNVSLLVSDFFLFVVTNSHGNNTTLTIVDTRPSHHVVAELSGHSSVMCPSSGVKSMALNDCTQEVFTCGSDRNILIWEPNVEASKIFMEEVKWRAEVGPLSVTADAWSSSSDDEL